MSTTLQPNLEIISGYRLIRYLGRGGFGEVWEAEAPGGLSKAIKVAPVEKTQESLNSRELAGLQKIRALRHPYLLSIERYEIVDQMLVIVMELADMSLGDRFNQCISEGKVGIPREELLGYLREAAEVLDLMNETHGLQHLDIKPENLFLSSGHVKVADFGLVQPRNTNMTTTTLAVSPPYAPPELFEGRVESTADQYSLAVTYQELLTGARPYEATDVRRLIYQHLTSRPDLSRLPPADRPIVGRALQREVNRRFSSCAAFVQALSQASMSGNTVIPGGVPVSTRPKTMTTITLPGQSFDLRQDEGVDAHQSARPHFVRSRSPLPPRTTAATVPLRPAAASTQMIEQPRFSAPTQDVRASFVAFLPIEIYAHKLRGFIDTLMPETVDCSAERTVLRFRTRDRGWFGFRSAKGMTMEIDACAITPHSGYRVVEVVVKSDSKHLQTTELIRRGMLLVRCLKSYLMATDLDPKQVIKAEWLLRAEILG